jgi:Tripartite tricarboxylate transporter TctB family
MNTDTADDQDESGIATWIVEVFVALCLFVLGAVVAYNSWKLGAGWRDDGPGAGYFPFYIGLLICISSAIVGVRGLRSGTRDEKVFVTHSQLKLVLTVLLPSLAFVVAVQVVGIYIGSFLFIAGFMIWVGKYHWAKSVGIAFAVMAIAFLMFEVWFKVPLFKGALDPLRFLGY